MSNLCETDMVNSSEKRGQKVEELLAGAATAGFLPSQLV